ncbi:hypothetical protein AB833_18605 [Chromatiales bacterium (ex Bugula neritina AB1)]|nr:hypothetical protein AB833_18605 [Chromatiales bacterium (ex Bugula neritina AB1)]
MKDVNFSYEFFPPGNLIGERRFWRSLGCIETMNPAFFSITYGALGTDQERSINTIENVVQETDVPIAAHLTFEGSTRKEINRVARRLAKAGVDKIVALRGDARADADAAAQRGPCYQSVAEFIAGLVEIYPFDISVACYPEVHPKALSVGADILELKGKCDAGANRAISQFFFDVDQFERFRDNATAAGINVPIVAGILPIRDFHKMTVFAERCGTKVPQRLYDLFEPAKRNPQLAAQIAQDEVESFIDRLISRDCSDFHIYTLNQPIELRQCAMSRQRSLAAPIAVSA